MDPVVQDAYDKVGQKAEGKVIYFEPETAIRTDELKPFSFESREQVINIETKEFSAVCPFSGLPDVAQVKIKYKPTAGIAVELKSLKYFFLSFRSCGIYQEGVTARIYKDLKNLLKTDKLYVSTLYNTRGGIDVLCEEGNKNF